MHPTFYRPADHFVVRQWACYISMNRQSAETSIGLSVDSISDSFAVDKLLCFNLFDQGTIIFNVDCIYSKTFRSKNQMKMSLNHFEVLELKKLNLQYNGGLAYFDV